MTQSVSAFTRAQTKVIGQRWCQWHNGFAKSDAGSEVVRKGRRLFKCFACQANEPKRP